jgi:hypothetical protein
MSLESISRKAGMTIGDSIDLLLVLAGSGSAATVLEIVKSWMPSIGGTLTDEQLMTALGFVLWWWGDKIHRRIVPFGFGILVQGGGQIIGPMISGILGSFTKPK